MPLLKEFEDEYVTSTSRHKFDKWVTSKNSCKNAIASFHELEHQLAPFSNQDRILLGLNKVLTFLKSINRDERMMLGILLEYVDGTNGLTEN